MFFVVPISQDDCEFLIIRMDFGGWMDDDWGTETVDVLTLR
jgi:hypothetical protein